MFNFFNRPSSRLLNIGTLELQGKQNPFLCCHWFCVLCESNEDPLLRSTSSVSDLVKTGTRSDV